MILKTVASGPVHGWAIGKRIQQISNDVLQVQQGSLYPALHRLENRGWLRAEAKPTESGRVARFYTLTPEGKKQLAKELGQWDRLSNAVGLVVKHA